MAIDRRRRDAVFAEQAHLPLSALRDDTYETHYVWAYRMPAWKLAKHARARAAEQLAWTENQARALRDVSVKRAAELDAVPVGEERPASPSPADASLKRKREELVGPNGETLDTHDFSIEKQKCGGGGQTIDVPTWTKKQRAE